MKKKIIFIMQCLSILFIFSLQLFSQEAKVITPYIQLQYFKNNDDNSILQTSLTYSGNRMEIPIPGAEISFFSDKDQKEVLASVLTDKKGVATFELTGDIRLKSDKDGLWNFSSKFKGNNTVEAINSAISVKDVVLKMELTVVDSIKTITVKAYINENGKEKAMSGEAVKIYVPRMFSLLPVSELTLDETGKASVEFPSDMPGDKEGNLTILAKFEENPTFGNVEKRETLKWGVPTDYSVPKTHRALWTKTAPKWMIYTLSVLLAGVWGHYLFAFISLIRIKIEAKKKARQEYRI